MAESLPFWKRATLLLLVSVSPGALFAAPTQDYMVKTWGVDEGLPESSVTDVVQTPEGYLWVSTLNSGLARFDGVRFVNFSVPFASQFISGGVRRLFVDEAGILWINGFGNYLAKLEAGAFHLERAQPAVLNYLVGQKPNHIVFATKDGQLLERSHGDDSTNSWKVVFAPGAGQNNHFFQDTGGNFWYRSTNGGVWRLSGERAEEMPTPGEPISALAGDARGMVVVGTASGLFRWNNDQFEPLTPTNGEPRLAVRGLVSDGQGGWWVEANGRLRRCQGRTWVAEATDWREQRRSWSRARWEQADSEGGLWLAYVDGGLVHVSASGKLCALTASDGLPSNRVRTLSQDREGNAWASFERGGLARVHPRLFQSVGSRQGLADTVTTSVCEDQQGAIWLGTLSGAVSCYSHGACTNFTLPQEGTHCEMSTVFPDALGRIWIGTHGNGLLVYEDGAFRHVLSLAQVGVNIRGIFVSHDGRVWIASQDGLFWFDNGELHRVLTPKSEADYPTALAEAANGALWVAMNSGTLVKLTGTNVEDFQPADPSMRSRFSAVCDDGQGNVWIGTLGAGLLRFCEGRFTAITRRDGLPTDSISQVLYDARGRLWLGSPVGVISVRTELLDSAKGNLACRVYGCDEGLPTVGCATASQPTAWRGHDGRLWFATASGVTSVQPSYSETKKRPPLVVLEDLLVDGQPADSAALAHGTGHPQSIRLSPGRHHLEFRYAGLSFAAPERTRFRYILQGLDEAWVENRTERNAAYNSVPAGNYRFRVMACNSDGVWSEAEAALALVIPPHLWETPWFRFAALVATLVAVAGSVFWTLQLQHRRELRALEQQRALERERTRIARDIHDDLGASLTRITMLSQSALDKTQSILPPNSEVNRIYSTARAMTNAMDEIVWAINPRHDSLESVAAYFAEFVEEFLSPAGLKFRLEIPLTLPQWPVSAEVRHNLFLAFKEALNNALKHSKATEVVVALEVREKGFTLSVEDNGCGFETAVLAGNGHSRAGEGNGRESARAGGGNGLINMRRRLEELGGRCTIDSLPGRGTRILFEVDV
jgi:signal transduction histidine kinase/ligand-binding sensor domain-containing protein